MREVYRDAYCRLMQTDNTEVGSRKKEYKLVSLGSDYLPPHWPNHREMLRSYKEIRLLEIQKDP